VGEGVFPDARRYTGETLRLRVTYGARQTYTQRPPLAIQESLIGYVVRSGMPIAVLDVRAHARYHFMGMARHEGLCPLLRVPLYTNMGSLVS
jgi:signal transduction protein with GAF and PtsI domain